MATPETVTSGAGHSPPTNGTVVAPSGGTGKPPEQMSEAEFREKNSQRIELIRKEDRQGLSSEEQGTLQRLEEEVAAWVNAHYPPPPVDTDLLREVIRKAEAGVDASNGA